MKIPSAPKKERPTPLDSRVMPSLIIHVIRDIQAHPDLEKLDSSTKIQINNCINPSFPYRSNEDNNYLQEIWRHLYLGEDLPMH